MLLYLYLCTASDALIVSRPVIQLPSSLHRCTPSPTPPNVLQYNRAEHNIFLRMQMADPLLPKNGRSVTPSRPSSSQEVSTKKLTEESTSTTKETERSKDEENENTTDMSSTACKKVESTGETSGHV